jgi:hypothetical protein
MQSSVPKFKKALLARLLADTTLAANSLANGTDLTISWGNPHPDQASQALVVIDDTKNRQLAWVAAMTQANETYDVSIYISITGSARNDREALWQRAYDLSDAVQNSVLAWAASGYGGTVSIVIPQPSHDQDAVANEMREAAIMFDLSVTARLS